MVGLQDYLLVVLLWLQPFSHLFIGYRGLQGIKRGLQGVTGGYRGLQEVTGGYRGLQEVTRGYRGLQWVTGGYRGLQGVTGFPKEKMNTNCTWKIRHAS